MRLYIIIVASGTPRLVLVSLALGRCHFLSGSRLLCITYAEILGNFVKKCEITHMQYNYRFLTEADIYA